MKNITIRQLDRKNEEIADELISLGIKRPIARILSYLKLGNETTSVDLERGTGLRQPEVSVAMRELKQHDWINERENKKPGKGRPYRVYSLKVGFNEIVAQLEKQRKKAFDETLSKIERLKKLGNITHIGS
ncbi:MAG TPA: transcriptional regulator protein [Candidatus Methanoperedens sp.]